MTFLELYGEAVSHELGSEDQIQLFTIARRKNAVNRAAREFSRLTKLSIPRELSIALVGGTARYNLDTLTVGRFIAFNRTPIRFVVTTGSATQATELVLRNTAWMDVQSPGWRDSTATGAPVNAVHDPVMGVNNLQVTPVPAIPGGQTWALLVPYQGSAGNMTADTDLPFDGLPDIEPYHWALAHFAAAILERLRKDTDAEKGQIAKFGAYIDDFNASRMSKQQHKRALQQRDYLRQGHRSGILVQGDPRV